MVLLRATTSTSGDATWTDEGTVVPVTSVFARTGDVVAVAGDYNSDQVTNNSGVAGATVSDALDNLAGMGGAPVKVVTAVSPYNVDLVTNYVLCSGTGQTVNLPAGATHTTGVITIKDRAGTAGTSPITIVPNGAEIIDGDSTFVLGGPGNGNYAAVTLVYAAGEWSAV